MKEKLIVEISNAMTEIPIYGREQKNNYKF